MVRNKYKYIIGAVLGISILICIIYVVVIKCRYVEDIEDVEPTMKSVLAENESLRKIVIQQNSLSQNSEHLLVGNLSDTGLNIIIDHISTMVTRDFLAKKSDTADTHDFCLGYFDGWKKTISSDPIDNYFPYIWHGNIMLSTDENGNEQLIEIVFVNEYQLQFTNDIIPAEYKTVEHIDMVHQYNSRTFSSGAFSFQRRSDTYYNGYEAGKTKAKKLWADAIDEIEKIRKIHVIGDISTVRKGNVISEQEKIERINSCPSVGAIYFLQRLLKKENASSSETWYDKTSQLVNAKYTKLPEEKYSYDPNGNRKTNKTGEYNRLLSDNENSYQYDNEGNRIAKISGSGTTKYKWDSRNRLVKVETPTETVEYVYDYLNRLVKRKQDKNETVFIHDNYQVVLQLENNKPTHQYLWGINQDELLCDNDNWTLGDYLNSVRDIVSTNGSITHFEYDAFGKLLSEKTDNTVFAYTGKMRDNVSDLQWNINRWYDANVGRWCSEDPIGFRGKDTNIFRYVGNESLIKQDARGLQGKRCPCPPASNPARIFNCCKGFKRAYEVWTIPNIQATVGLSPDQKLEKCVTNLLEETYENEDVSAAVQSGIVVIVSEGSLSFFHVATPWITVPVSIAAGVGSAYLYPYMTRAYARKLCNSFVCTKPETQPECSCQEGRSADFWTCQCSGGVIYQPSSEGMYTNVPSDKSEEVLLRR